MVSHTHQDVLNLAMEYPAESLACCPINKRDIQLVSPLGMGRDLLDYNRSYERKIMLSELDKNLDDKGDLDVLLSQATGLDCLYLIDDRVIPDNPLVVSYDEFTKERYLCNLKKAGVNVKLCRVMAD